SGQDYTLQSTSPAIDSATTTIYTADYLGNTFYGTPDTGAYEYQPPHDIAPVTPDTIDIGAGARIYGDGKFRDLGTINGNAAHLKITPSGGSFDVFGSTAKRPAWLDVTNITNWSNTHKTWTESNASSSDMVTDHTIGDLHANKYYTITITGATASDITGINGTTCNNGVCQSDGSGNLSFRYTGGYSNHTFDMFENPTAPTAPVLGTPTTVAVPLSWTAGGGTETVYVLEKSLDGGSSFVEVATVNVPTTNYTFTGLSPNNLYQFRVAAGDGVHTTSTYATSSLIYTLANQASAPTLSTATTSTIPLYINANGNPIGTTYAVYDATDSRYFTSAGAITATPTFFTSSSWSGITRGLNASSYYTFQVIARNGDGVNSATSSGATAGTASVAVNLSKTIVYTNEGIATDTYTIVLNSQPTSTVQILISPDSSSLVSPSTINFTPANWSTPVTVTVTAVVRNQGGHLSTITHTASSIVAGYRNVTIASVTNSITARTVGAGGGGGGGGLPPVITHYESGTSDPNRAANLANLNSIGLPVNSLVKLPDDGNGATQEDSAVYYIGSDGKRHAFPNSKIYFTWYSDFSGVRIITADQLASIPLGTNVRYKPGSRMVKFTTDLKVYAVDANGVLRWVKTEAVAKALYGDNWNTFIDDLSDAFFSNYSFGSDINSAADFNVSTTMGLEATISDNLVKKASS
ncbi:MAG: fibronectin type III domain-containing protein, partial [Patescibacteria group bacterium]|nr:fibronectin type III domain-containing protein [Patescibacteria group bacterium]